MTARALCISASTLGLLVVLGTPTACGDSAGSPDNAGGSSAEAGNGTAGDPESSGGGAMSLAGVPSGGGDQSGAGASEGGATSNGGASSSEGGAGGGVCGAVEKREELAAGLHVLECAPIAYATNPPSSGEHYPVWASYGEHDFALPRGYWVHNLEHGSVVVTYNCPEGCEDDLTAARAWLASLEPDVACGSGPARVLLVPDPLLNAPWAASSWGYTLRANCFDADTFSAFYEAHVGQPPAPEASICSPGSAIGRDACAE